MTSSPPTPLDRRRLLLGAGSLGLTGLGGCTTSDGLAQAPTGPTAPAQPLYDRVPPLAPVRARLDRLFDITVCLRPFRAAGPRLDTEQVGGALVVHNYGHGGSGWSLSWGSGTIAVQKAMANSPKDVAVIGCGALGLTAAILAQRAGANVTIYARDLLPQTRSARATGSWTPDSRIALAGSVDPGFPALWEQMARTSFKTYRSYLGLPGSPVEWTDRYFLSDLSHDERVRRAPVDPLGFASFGDRIADITPRNIDVAEGASPFPVRYVRRTSSMMFNIADYGHTLTTDFLLAGGRFERREFNSPAEIGALKEKVVINCTGYGARALWKDETIVPVRGQIGWLIPQPEVNYGFIYDGVSMLSRRDGIVIQMLEGGDMRGYGDANETVDRAESEDGVRRVAAIAGRMRG